MKRIAVVLALLTVLGATACAPSAPSAADQKAACFDNEKIIKAEFDLFYADSGIYPPMSDVLGKLHLKCPSGGTYTFDAKTDTVSCSVHGRP